MTTDDVIDALGGTGKVAALFGVLPSAVSNWRAAGEFPARMHYRVYEACQRAGIDWRPPAPPAPSPQPERAA